MYPKTGKKVFKESVDGSENAIISFSLFASKSFEYENAYLNAADILVEGFICQKGDFNSNLIYPIVFLYRQYLELFMKDILKNYNKVIFLDKLDDKESQLKKILGQHNLELIWEKIEELAISIGSEFPTKIEDMEMSEILNNTKKYIEEIENMDRKSFAFRYPSDKEDELYHKQIDTKISICNLKECVHEIKNVLLEIQGTLCYVREMNELIYHNMYL